LVCSIVTAIICTFGSLYVLPRLQRAKEPACHDAVYVMPLTDDEELHDSLPSRRLKFACPHADQRLELLGHGGIACKCEPYTRNSR
jgi:hypothetical protein